MPKDEEIVLEAGNVLEVFLEYLGAQGVLVDQPPGGLSGDELIADFIRQVAVSNEGGK